MCGIIMKRSNRKYFSIYFEDGLINKRKKRDITIAFRSEDPIYRKCKNLGSSKVKKIIGISSYKELVVNADKECRTPSNFIRYRLRKKYKAK